jgi:predicted metal-binding membrane protein
MASSPERQLAEPDPIEAGLAAVLRRDRWIMAGGLAGLTLLAWLYLVWDMRRMAGMPGMDMAMPMPMPDMPGMVMPAMDASAGLALTFAMWSVMMVAMMLPSAAPTILIYVRMARQGRARSQPLPGAWIFTSGYLLVWFAFSLGAALLQTLLQGHGLLTPALAARSGMLEGLLLALAGGWQWLPVKDACLSHCRSPIQFLAERWRPGARGALLMGVEHGAFCVGCCWALMLLLFVGGVMNLLLVATIAGVVLIEKLLPPGRWIGKVLGAGLVAAGIWRLAAAV